MSSVELAFSVDIAPPSSDEGEGQRRDVARKARETAADVHFMHSVIGVREWVATGELRMARRAKELLTQTAERIERRMRELVEG